MCREAMRAASASARAAPGANPALPLDGPDGSERFFPRAHRDRQPGAEAGELHPLHAGTASHPFVEIGQPELGGNPAAQDAHLADVVDGLAGDAGVGKHLLVRVLDRDRPAHHRCRRVGQREEVAGGHRGQRLAGGQGMGVDGRRQQGVEVVPGDRVLGQHERQPGRGGQVGDPLQRVAVGLDHHGGRPGGRDGSDHVGGADGRGPTSDGEHDGVPGWRRVVGRVEQIRLADGTAAAGGNPDRHPKRLQHRESNRREDSIERGVGAGGHAFSKP
jgi:hypothetical protein